MFIIFLTTRGWFTKNSSWQAKRSIPHTTVIFHGDCVEMYEGFGPNFGDKRAGCCITTTHSLTLLFPACSEFFYQNNMTAVPHPPYFSPFPIVKTNPKGRHCYTTEVIEAESQAELNTLREQ
jgi:hypothetical protein